MSLPDLNSMYSFGTAGDEFVTDTAGAGKKIQYMQAVEIEYIIEYIEKTFPCHVGGGPQFESRWRLNKPSLICAADYAQLTILKRLQ